MIKIGGAPLRPRGILKDVMAQPEKRENSVLFSLRELRQIEQNRVQEEEHAVKSAEEHQRRTKEDEERRIREAEEHKVRSAEEAQKRELQARELAEREARLALERTEAEARIKAQSELEQQRLMHEMELRRQEVAKKRPTWMLAVTGVAVVAVLGFGVLVYMKVQSTKEAEAFALEKQKQADEATKEAKAAGEQAAQALNDLKDIQAKSDAVQTALNTAKDEAGRRAAQAQLDQLNKDRAAAEQRAAAAKAAADHANRMKGVHISKECLDNPLAKGC
jgi:hypothetical protein